MSMFCPNCGKSNPSGATFCNGCGKQLPVFSTTVKCPYCGAEGQEYQVACTKCGKELPKGQTVDPLTGTQTQPPAMKACPICGRPMSIYATQCSYCSRPDSEYDYSSENVYTSESQLPTIGGVLIIIAGVLGILEGLLTFGAIGEVSTMGYSVPGSVTCCAGLMVIFGLVALLGGWSAMGRNSLVFAIAGGIFGILAIGFLIGALLSLIGIILVAVAHTEFTE